MSGFVPFILYLFRGGGDFLTGLCSEEPSHAVFPTHEESSQQGLTFAELYPTPHRSHGPVQLELCTERYCSRPDSQLADLSVRRNRALG